MKLTTVCEKIRSWYVHLGKNLEKSLFLVDYCMTLFGTISYQKSSCEVAESFMAFSLIMLQLGGKKNETVQNGKRPNLCDDALQYSDDCSQPINNTSCSLLNNTESPEKNFQSDCSHNSQNTCMFQDGSSTCSSLEESLKSDNQNDSDSNNINQYEFVGGCDDLSCSSTDSLDSIDKESFNSSFHSEETIDFSFHSDESTNSSFHSDNETETDREENLTEKRE
ncbi:hypothetical protein KUTeg_011227 [Tegillarca granosa]|uniref:Uncharacterized protein n=1 Tax=Tegillarca granosa TaxID=220873 RepID=A0ABQ9F6M5_TEGGR|nr:hypothetical protein KUTeg_011227 [Tegillarca granosa]